MTRNQYVDTVKLLTGELREAVPIPRYNPANGEDTLDNAALDIALGYICMDEDMRAVLENSTSREYDEDAEDDMVRAVYRLQHDLTRCYYGLEW